MESRGGLRASRGCADIRLRAVFSANRVVWVRGCVVELCLTERDVGGKACVGLFFLLMLCWWWEVRGVWIVELASCLRVTALGGVHVEWCCGVVVLWCCGVVGLAIGRAIGFVWMGSLRNTTSDSADVASGVWVSGLIHLSTDLHM
jgi:hypothetical protein